MKYKLTQDNIKKAIKILESLPKSKYIRIIINEDRLEEFKKAFK